MLLAASLIFYALAGREHLEVLLFSLLGNYCFGRWMQRCSSQSRNGLWGRLLLAIAVLFNAGILGYFKYFGFIASVLHWPHSGSVIWHPARVPLGISFYTLTQVMYLIDSGAGLIEKPYPLVEYGFFVAFFPYALAGPLIKHEEIISQIHGGIRTPDSSGQIAGWTLFAIGLFKKVIFADHMALLANPFFETAARGPEQISFLAAWAGALAFTLQLYFDFSGYSDMVVGLGHVFGIRLPINFNSPLKALNIIDFWKRWHITLTRFLTNYVYNPLVMAIARRRQRNHLSLLRSGEETLGGFLVLSAGPTMVTMFVSGLWHGAGWQFIWVGLLHGIYLTCNHGYRILRKHHLPVPKLGPRSAQLLTFVAVVISIVFFRSNSVKEALGILKTMAGACRWGGIHLITPPLQTVSWISGLLIVVWFFPNSQEFVFRSRNELKGVDPFPPNGPKLL